MKSYLRHSQVHFPCPPIPLFPYSLILLSILYLSVIGCAQPSSDQNFSNQIEKQILPGAFSTEKYLPLLQGKRVGLMVNQTSVVEKTHLLDTLLKSKVNVVKVFAPEHGFRGKADAGELVNDSIDLKTGISIISLYGKKKKPVPKDLEGIDMIVFDIQDVGVRFYTYIYSLQYLMEALSEAKIPLIVLDRPNPNGHYIDGPILDTAYASFVGLDPIPVVYGLTIGEFGQMINGEKWIKGHCDLTVIPCTNYDHTMMYTLPVKPSPNLPNQRSILLYPGICFFEGTSYSLGRGTNMQFQVVGSPDYPDHAFSFTPRAMEGAMNPPLKDQLCYGVDLTKLDVDSLFKTKQMNLSVLLDVYQKSKKESFFNAEWFDKLAGGPGFRESILKGLNEDEVRQTWRKGLEDFRLKRKPYLLYKDFEN